MLFHRLVGSYRITPKYAILQAQDLFAESEARMARTLRPDDGIRYVSDEELLSYKSQAQDHFSRGDQGITTVLSGNERSLSMTLDTHAIAEIKGVLRALNPDQFRRDGAMKEISDKAQAAISFDVDVLGNFNVTCCDIACTGGIFHPRPITVRHTHWGRDVAPAVFACVSS